MFKKVLLTILLVVVLIVAGFCGFVAMQPSDYRISRSAKMAASPAQVFDQVNDFHKWDAWSPWIQLDPNAKATYEGPSSGKGAIFAWSGNDEVGEGRMTILESKPNELVRIKLDFIKPFEDSCTTEFTLQPEGSQTLVTWAMFGQHGFVDKAMCLVLDMDKLVGEKFEEGLASIKKIVESDK